MTPAGRQDIESERQHFDEFYGPSLARDHRAMQSDWDERAKHPRARPLDYWEYAMYLLGDLRGRQVLDLGCGGGWITRLLAEKGARVAGCDVSLQGCRLTQAKLQANGHTGAIAVMDGHELAFHDETFDAVFFSGVLHHMNIPAVTRELYRVLKPGGRLVGYEPLRYGPFMWWLRQMYLKARGMQEYPHSDHEEELTVADLAPLAEIFRSTKIISFNVVGKVGRLKNRWGPLASALRWADYVLLSSIPYLRRFATTVVCYAEK